MSKKNAPRRKKAAKATHPPIAVPRSVGLAQMRALEPQYIAWAAGDTRAADAAAEWSALTDFLAAYAEDYSFGTVDALEPDALAELLETAIEEVPEAMPYLPLLLDRYLHFLDENGHWKRGEEEFDAVHEALSGAGWEPGFEFPELSPAEIDAQGREVPLVRWATALLGWLGGGRAMPASGMPEADDLGVALSALEGQGGEASIRRLPTLWRSMEAAGLLMISGNRAVGTDLGAALVGPGTEDFPEACFQLLFGYFEVLVHDAAGHLPGAESAATVLRFLAQAAGDDPPPANIMDMDWSGPSLGEASEAVEAIRLALPLLNAALDAGLLTEAGGKLIVPPVIREPLAAFIQTRPVEGPHD